MILTLTASEIERFHSKIERGPGCWEWAAELNNKGYGRFVFYRGGARHRILAHRLAHFLASGDDSTGRVLRHSCDNPRCARPDHLMPGTQADNVQDTKQRDRMNLAGLRARHEETRARILANLADGRKECTSCGAVKSLDGFRRESRRLDGRSAWCRDCLTRHERKLRRITREAKHQRTYCPSRLDVA